MLNNATVTCDIDGVLNFYPQIFIDYAQNEHNLFINDLPQFKNQCFQKYTEIKSAYRYSAYKHEAESRSAVVSVLNSLANKGIQIVVFTSRPFDRYPGMFELTLQWLQSIGLQFVKLLPKTKSNLDVIKPLFHLDDRLDHILNIYSPKTAFLLLQDCTVNHDVLPYRNIVQVTEHTLSDEIERLIHD